MTTTESPTVGAHRIAQASGLAFEINAGFPHPGTGIREVNVLHPELARQIRSVATTRRGVLADLCIHLWNTHGYEFRPGSPVMRALSNRKYDGQVRSVLEDDDEDASE